MRSLAVIGAFVAIGVWATTGAAAPRTFSAAVDNTIVLTSDTLARWEVHNDFGTNPATPAGTCVTGGNSQGLSVMEAVLDPNGANRGDAFDGAFALWVNDQRFIAPDGVDVTDQTLTAGPIDMSGLKVTMEYRALQSLPMLRALVTFENPTNLPFEGTVVLGTNFGSDAATAERGRGPTLNWHVTSDSDTTPTDPVVLLVSNGPDPFADQGIFTILLRLSTTANTFTCNTNNGRQLSAPLLIPPGQTVRLLEFAQLASTNAAGVAAGAAFDQNPSLDSDLMAGISAEQALSIANWAFYDTAVLSGGGASWLLSGLNGTSNGLPTGGKCGAIPGIGLVDALNATPTFDAFDGGLLLFVDDVPLPLTTPISEEVGVAARLGPVTLSGLEVSLTHTALQNAPTLRTLVRVSNPTATAVTTKIALATNFGSDGVTLIRSTSDGDEAITSADRWAITSDDRQPPDADVVNTHVVAGPGTLAVPPALGTDIFECSGPTTGGGLIATYLLTIGPGETQTLLLYNQIHTQLADATADVTTFDETPTPENVLLSDVDFALLSTVVNWNLCRGVSHSEVLCRLSGLRSDAFAATPAGSVRDKLLSRLDAANSAVEDARTASCAGKKAASKRKLKAASAALNSFAKILKAKKAKAAIRETVRTRMGTTTGELRTTVKQLASQPTNCSAN